MTAEPLPERQDEKPPLDRAIQRLEEMYVRSGSGFREIRVALEDLREHRAQLKS